MDIDIVPMQESDWPQVAKIFRAGIETCLATFETNVPDYNSWDQGHCKPCRLSARAGADVAGWAALSPLIRRNAYAGVAEASIYIGDQYKGKGVGKALLNALIESSEQNGFWTLHALITRENTASISLFAKCGFREIGFWERVGRTPDGVWHDVLLMERRSRVTGTD